MAWSVALFFLLLCPIISVGITHFYFKIKAGDTIYIGISLSLPILWILIPILFGIRHFGGLFLGLFIMFSSPIFACWGLILIFKAQQRNESNFIIRIATLLAWGVAIYLLGMRFKWFS